MSERRPVLPEEPLDPGLKTLYEAEARTPLPAGAEQRVLSGVIERLAADPTAGSPAGSSESALAEGAGGVAAKKVVAIAILSALAGAALGVALHRGLSSEKAPAMAPEKAQRPPAKSLSPLPQPAAPPDEPQELADAALPPLPRPGAHNERGRPRDASAKDEPQGRPGVKGRPGPKAEQDPEALLIDRARIALRRRLVDEALVALMQHERRFPEGQLAEERDVLLVEAYVDKGDPRLAERRIQRYRKNYPAGTYRSRVDRAEERMLNTP